MTENMNAETTHLKKCDKETKLSGYKVKLCLVIRHGKYGVILGNSKSEIN